MNLLQALELFNISQEQLSYITPQELKELYHKLAKIKHPDKSGGDSGEFIALKDAYLLISTVVQENTTRDMVSLEKDEILNRYSSETKDLHLKLINQYQSINKIRNEVEKLINEFEQKKKEIEIDLDVGVEELEKKYKKKFWQKVLFFLPSMSESDFREYYNELLQDQTLKLKELDFELFKKMNTIYGKGLNEISETLDNII
jgi:hypothetical protein